MLCVQYFTHTKRAKVDEFFESKWDLFYGRWAKVRGAHACHVGLATARVLLD